jgi:hypothetical protein
MSTTSVTRPIFYEGQILASADLTATVDYARQQMARHACFAHIPGIVTGCAVTATSGPGGVTVSVGSGIVTDGTGREIVIPGSYQLDPSQATVTPLANVWYPVFVTGVDQQASPSSNLTGTCDASQSTRMQEYYQFQIGAAGSELASAPAQPAVTSVPGNPGWQTLLGFVQFTTSPTVAFSSAITVNPDNNVGPQYVGVYAAEVESPSGSLLLSTHPPGYTGANPVMGIEITEANGGQLVFGQVNANGSVTPGAIITAQGLVPGPVAPGSVQVQSGVAYDGMTLPLPLGINASDVLSGNVVAHVHVSLRMDNLAPPDSPSASPQWIMVPSECRADSGTRLVHCQVQWVDTSGANPTQFLPAFCDYTVIVAVPASGGGS